MMLHKYRCSTCGNIWYEEEHLKLSVAVIKHGCPCGCDDTGEYLGYIDVLISSVNNLKIGKGTKSMEKAEELEKMLHDRLSEDDYKMVVGILKEILLFSLEDVRDVIEKHWGV